MARARANWEGAYDVSHVVDDGADAGARAGWVGRRGEYYSVHEDTTIGWDEAVGVNECVDKEGRFVPAGTFKALSGGPPMPDPRAPARRAFDDPAVVALREELRAKNGLADIEICEPHELDRIERLFRRDGFCVVANLLSAQQLDRFRESCSRQLEKILADRGVDGRKYKQETGRLPHRYCWGNCSATREMWHDPGWYEHVDLDTTYPILCRLLGTDDIVAGGSGGDLSLPGAMEYQHLHQDGGQDAQLVSSHRLEWARDVGVDVNAEEPEGDFVGVRKAMEATAGVTISWCLSDWTFENGPIRQIPGSHTSMQPIPSQEEEPGWMRVSTLVGAPAGGGILRDSRCWHGATPNLSKQVRAMPLHGYGRGGGPRNSSKHMPHDIYTSLSPRAQRICRYLPADPGEEIKGLGVMHPWTCVREEATGVEWNENGHPTTNPLTDLKNYTDSSGRTSSSAAKL